MDWGPIMNFPVDFDRKRAVVAQEFVSAFMQRDNRPKLIFGCNVYGPELVKHTPASGFIDDFSEDKSYLGLPILRMKDVPANALVLVASGGRPFSALKRCKEAGIDCLDYFSFYRFSHLPLREIAFNEGFAADYEVNSGRFEAICNRLADDESKEIFRKLTDFRLSYDLDHLKHFTAREDEQYFEPFLELKSQNESFFDVGSFDGFTSEAFIKSCPDYRSIHVFEPDPKNIAVCKRRLSHLRDVHFHQLGLSNVKETLSFNVAGSSSRVSADGSVKIEVDRLDAIATDVPTLIKMDIEGGELHAIDGAVQTISRAHPRLAISIYHSAGDFWRIPEKVLAIRDDYRLFVRHYTESIYETVMFFLPA